MDRIPVDSSNIASIGYDAEDKTLEVEFNDGPIYRYYDVPSSVHEGLMSASSHGSYLHEHVKGVYRYEQIR